MATMSERVRLMKEGFMELHNDGKTISEIADIFHLSTVTIYRNLQEIADENGVSREDLLQIVHKQHSFKSANSSREKINPEKLLKNFDEIFVKVDSLIGKLDTILEKEQEEEYDRA